MASPLVRVPSNIRDEVLTLCRLEREGFPVKAVIEQAIAALHTENPVNSPANSREIIQTVTDLLERVKVLEELTALLTSSKLPVNQPVNSRPTRSKQTSVLDAEGWLTVEEAWTIATERGCPASLSTFRRWARGNASYPDGDEASLQRWGFCRDVDRLSGGTPRSPARFLRQISETPAL